MNKNPHLTVVGMIQKKAPGTRLEPNSMRRTSLRALKEKRNSPNSLNKANLDKLLHRLPYVLQDFGRLLRRPASTYRNTTLRTLNVQQLVFALYDLLLFKNVDVMRDHPGMNVSFLRNLLEKSGAVAHEELQDLEARRLHQFLGRPIENKLHRNK